jgi:hypothetical protein
MYLNCLEAVTKRRRGSASVEYAMSLPILLFLLATIMSTAFLGLGRIRVSVEARHQAWNDREDQRTGKPLYFAPPGGESALVVTKTRDVKVFTINGSNITARSKVAVNGGSWDWRDVDPTDIMKTTKDMIFSLPGSAAGDFQSVLSQLGNLGATLGGVAGSMLASALDANKKADQLREDSTKKLQEHRQDIARQLAQAQQQLTAAKTKEKQDEGKIAKLQEERKKAEKLKDAKERLKELARIDKEIQMRQKDVDNDNKMIAVLQRQVDALLEAQRISNNLGH